MKVHETALPGVILIEPEVFGDSRGYFLEAWNVRRYAEAGLAQTFVQDNISFSRQGILRGLHLQNPRSQGKLVYVLAGEVYDVAVDLRRGSPHFGCWFGVTLSAQNHRQLYIPEGFGHGFCVLSESALFAYKCTDYYFREAEMSVRWDDPDLAIDWPVDNPALSAKDAAAPFLTEIPAARLPAFA